MESKKRFERWTRYKIALNERKEERTSSFENDGERPRDDRRCLAKIENAPTKKISPDANGASNRLPFDASGSSGRSLFANEPSVCGRRLPSESPSLRERARRAQTNAESERNKSTARWELSENSASARGSEFFSKRSRTFRMSAPPRRFDGPRRDRERE